jgi:hypothetical protein
MCVQRLDDSLNSAIHITYRISLRSSSMQEPRDPLLKVLLFERFHLKSFQTNNHLKQPSSQIPSISRFRSFRASADGSNKGFIHQRVQGTAKARAFDNDPSAGSPTETLLRLLLPLNDQV